MSLVYSVQKTNVKTKHGFTEDYMLDYFLAEITQLTVSLA